jgi:uncharacterized protein DUF3592
MIDRIPQQSANRLPSGRRTLAVAIRWLSLPLAVLIAVASICSLRSEYLRIDKLIPTKAIVIDARVVSTSRVTTEWEAYVRYPVRGKDVENSVRVWALFELHNGDAITLLVDPATSDAQDDLRAWSWAMAGIGLLAALFMVAAGFIGMGRMLQRDDRAP